MLMNILLSMVFPQTATETKKAASPEIVAAFNCLTKHIDDKLSKHNKPSEFREIWGYANDITDLCSEEIRLASSIEEPVLFELGDDNNRKITREQAFRAEARYYTYDTILKVLEKRENPMGITDE